jgi:cell filamentation protein
MPRYSDRDAYLDPDSGVLKDRFGVTEAATLEALETDLAGARFRELATRPLAAQFNLSHLQAIRQYLFGDLYEWAGELRTVDISKNGHVFAHHTHIAASAADIFRRLASENHLRGLGKDAFAFRSAYYLVEINALHPFREGNGRTQREFMSALATATGFYFAWEQTSQEEMLQASIASFHGKLDHLTAILKAIL